MMTYLLYYRIVLTILFYIKHIQIHIFFYASSSREAGLSSGDTLIGVRLLIPQPPGY